MIADRVRTDAYAEALRQAVRPGSVVLDIGTGTGFFALLACRFGARKVYAVDPSDAIVVGHEIARANGYADRIEFIQRLSTEITLRERADVMVSDLRGILPLFQHHFPAIIDARQRLLAPGGIQIPQSDTLWAAVVSAEDVYNRYTSIWKDNPYDVDMRSALSTVTNNWSKRQVTPDQLLSESGTWATVDYTRIEGPNVGGEVTLQAVREGTGHGLAVWFDSTLIDGVQMTNAPGSDELIYGAAYFPWSEPVEIAARDSITIGMRGDLVGNDYIWRWKTRVVDETRTLTKTDFTQSTLLGAPLPLERLRKARSDHVPSLNDEGEVDRAILALMDGENSVRDIAEKLADQFPGRFASWQDALTNVGLLSDKYSR